jgi:hypothetical protein
MRHRRAFAFVAAAGLLITPAAAWAYVDPSAGSIFLQLLLGGVAGLLVAVKVFYQRILSWFGRRPPETPAAGNDTEPPR